MKPNVLFVGPCSGGGMTTVLRTLCSQIPGSPIVCSYRGGSKPRKAIDALRGLLTLRHQLRRHPDISIVHIHTASNASFRRKMHFARLAKRMDRKVVMHIHGGGFADFLATDPEGIVADLNGLDAVICLSRHWADILKGAGVERVFVLPNPVPEPKYVEVIPDGKVHFIFLGLLHHEKGVNELLQAAADNRERWKGKLMIHVAGTGPAQTDMRGFIDRHSLSELVKLDGWVEGASKDRLFSCADVLLLPSYVEAMPVAILEAMSYGLPVIATPVGSIPTMVHDGENGILIPAADSKALADAIDRLLDNPSLRRQMGQRGKLLTEPLRPENIGAILDNIYRQL